MAVVDTSVLIGFADSSDRHHAMASEIIHGIDLGRLPTGIISTYIILETLDWIHARMHRVKSREVCHRLIESRGCEVYQAAKADFNRSVELFDQYEGLAFGDATIVAYMEREGIEYLYSFDDDFDAIENITRLASPDDPFD